MTRPLLATLLIAATTTTAAQPAPPRLLGAQVVWSGRTLAATWQPPSGQDLMCAIRTEGTDVPLEPCHTGHGGRHTFYRPADGNLQVAVGDTVQLRVYDVRRRGLGLQLADDTIDVRVLQTSGGSLSLSAASRKRESVWESVRGVYLR